MPTLYANMLSKASRKFAAKYTKHYVGMIAAFLLIGCGAEKEPSISPIDAPKIVKTYFDGQKIITTYTDQSVQQLTTQDMQLGAHPNHMIGTEAALFRSSAMEEIAWLPVTGEDIDASLHDVLIDPAAPKWIHDFYPTLRYSLLSYFNDPVYANSFGALEITDIYVLYKDGATDELNIQAFTEPHQIVIRLHGGGFEQPNDQARFLISQNLAHEFTHIWQLQYAFVQYAPNIWHEGVAEKIGYDALAALSASEPETYPRHNALYDAKTACANAMLSGDILSTSNKTTNISARAAGYDCGRLAWHRLQQEMQLHHDHAAAEIWDQFHQDQLAKIENRDLPMDQAFQLTAFLDFVEGQTDKDFRLKMQKFLSNDYQHTDTTRMVDDFMTR